MSKKFLSIILSIIICFSFLSITCFATNNSDVPSSSVTFKINMTEKMKAYYAKIEIKIAKLTTDDAVEQVYYFTAPDYADFSVTTSLPNGNYVLLSACIPNDLDHTPAPTQKFTVGEKAHLIVEAEVKKDMSSYPDRTTAPQTTTSTIENSTLQSTTDVPTSTTTISNESTTLPLNDNTENTSLSWIKVLIPIAIIVASGFIIFIIVKKIKENRDNPSI